ncbi:unnamed protein product [Durusdinium trenchii]|uniref:CERLI1-like PH domain-containing protein n=1 Tax=Durusdinium trenchii TaxID=1381693 RepID=A0ABP0RHT7_9DINO
MVGCGAFVSLCAVCGLYRCSRNCGMRDCGCCKRCLRSTGIDAFDDFELLVVVHEALYTGGKSKSNVCVRVTAGMQSAATSENPKAVFHESLSILVEQGTDVVLVELWDVRERRAMASLKFDPMKDLLHSEDLGREKVYPMKQKTKGLLNPRVRLSLHLDTDEGMEKGLLQDVDMSRETDMMLRTQLQKAQASERARGGSDSEDAPAKELSKVELFAKGCAGPLDQFGSWGRRDPKWICVRGPPDQKRHTLCIYKDESQCRKGDNPEVEVELLKVLSVQPDPARKEVFIINYLEKNKVKQRLTFSRIDRSRDIWVEMLTLLITMIREEKESKPSPSKR